MRKLGACVLVIVGILFLLYPTAKGWYENRLQERLLAEWENTSYDEAAEKSARQQYEQLTQLFDEESAQEEKDAPVIADEVEDLPTKAPNEDASREQSGEVPVEEPSSEPGQDPDGKSDEKRPRPIAVISIDKIKLKLPILEGATEKNMKAAATHLTETATWGQVGNAAIAGHRMRSKGKLFNRLGEVEVGDKIVIETKEEAFTYTVYKVSIVEPEDVSVLNYNQTDKLLTLITCEPIVNPTHRLIIHAKL